jgi:hypothetical protein
VAIKAVIEGADGSQKLKVGPEGEAFVVVHPHPPFEEISQSLPYRGRFSNSAGATNMNVDGSVTNQDFYLSAINDRDIYVNSISIRIADTGSLALNKFGALTALTNGVEWEWSSQDVGIITLHDGIKTNLEFIRTGHKTSSIGTGNDAYLADVSGGGTESAYLPIIDISEQFGKPWGIRLRKGTNDKMTFRIRDSLTGLTNFDAIAYGTQF